MAQAPSTDIRGPDGFRYDFRIQLSNPATRHVLEPRASALETAIESIFPIENEYALLIWNGVFVPLTYNFDVSAMIDDSLHLVEQLATGRRTGFELHWRSSSFSTVWSVESDEQLIHIDAQWYQVIGSVEDLLNRRNHLAYDLEDFLTQWRRLFVFLAGHLRAAGYDVEGLTALRRLEAAGSPR